MQMLYNSDAFTVLRLDLPPRPAGRADDPLGAGGAGGAGGTAPAAGAPSPGLEIVDKRGRRDIYLHGALAERFLQGAQALARAGHGEPEFDDFIEGFAAFGQQPLALH
jgi:hypothetical protein